MKIIISPAKKMKTDTDSLPWISLPEFLDSSKELLGIMQGMSYEELKKLWKCNDALAELNYNRIHHMELENALTPAILAYEGIQYQYMAPGVFTNAELEYVQQHLSILSGFYGILRPFDGVRPYRLEMQAKLKTGHARDLYSFWGARLAESLLKDSNCIINLASKEYSLCISKYIPDDSCFINCVFGEESDGRIVEKGTICKMARGEMVRYMAENNITKPEGIKNFDRLRFSYSPAHSTENSFVFILQK